MKKRAFTFAEILCAIAVIGILITGTVIGVNRLWQNNRIDICEADMREMTTGIKNYLTDYGVIEIEATDYYRDTAEEIVNELNRMYLPYKVNIVSIAGDRRSMELKTTLKDDPWGNSYQLNIYTYNGADADVPCGVVIISSNGADSISNKDSYSDDDYGDDVIAIVEPEI